MLKSPNFITKFLKKNWLLLSYILLAIFPLLLWLIISPNNKIPKIYKAPVDSGYEYVASNSLFKTYISEKNSTNTAVRFELKGTGIVFKTDEDGFKASRLTNRTVSFTKNNLEIRYSTKENGIKEEIILNSHPNTNEFKFNFWMNGIKVKKNTNISYTPFFFDSNDNYLFHFERPYAVDNKGNITYGVTYRITQGPHNEYILKVVVDEKWLNSSEREYPITIDPTIVHDTTSEFSTGQFNRNKDTGSGSSPNVTTYYQELSSDINTVALWHLNEASGNAIDSSGNSLTGTPTGTTVVTGILNNARQFNGSSDKITSSLATASTTNVNISAWFATSLYTADRQAIVYNGTSGGTNGYGIFINSESASTGEIKILYGGIVWYATGVFITDSNWHHISLNIMSDGHPEVYLDGKIIYVGTVSTRNTPTANTYIGTDNSGVGTPFFQGTIDEVVISNVARSSEEIKMSASRRPYSVYTSDVIDMTQTFSWNGMSWSELGVQTGDGETVFSSTSLISQWNFNATSGTSANNDAEGTSCAGTPANCDFTLTNFASTASQDQAAGTGWTSNNRRWGAGGIMLSSVATADSLIITNPASNALDPNSSDLSVEMWVKTNDVTADLFSNNQGNGTSCTSNGYYLGIDANGFPIFYLDTNGATAGCDGQITGVRKINDGNWHHIAATVTRGTGAYIYLDGVLIGSDTSITSYSSITSAGNVSIGGTNALDGIIDSTRVYARALTQNEIISNYQSSNLEIQTRVGSSADANDGTWEEWKTIANETQINSFDSDSSLWSWDSSTNINNIPGAITSDTVTKIEGAGSLELTHGAVQTDDSTIGLWRLDETSGTGAYIRDLSTNSYISTVSTGTGNDGAVTISVNKNINTDTIASGRTYADGIVYAVSALGSNTITVSTTNGIAANDEVMLMNLQGDSTNNGNAGNYEFIYVDSVTPTVITLKTNIQKIYGATTSNGTLTGQKVIVQRVPNYTNVTVNNGITLTASAWNGTTGGVVAFRATGTVTVTGTITTSGLGYRGGTGGTSSTASYAGESFDGYNGRGGYSTTLATNGGGNAAAYPSTASPNNGYARTGGGGGGNSGNCESTCGGGGGAGGGYGGGGGGGGGGGANANGGSGGSGGSTGVSGGGGGGSAVVTEGGAAGGNAGSAGNNSTRGVGGQVGVGNVSASGAGAANHSTAGAGAGAGGGGTKGYRNLDKIYLGGGGGGGGYGDFASGLDGSPGGGIIYISGATITTTGSILANGTNGTGTTTRSGAGGAGAGGTIYIQGSSVTLGTNLVTAIGGSSASTSSRGGGGGGGGVGRILVQRTTSLSGTTNPLSTPNDGTPTGTTSANGFYNKARDFNGSSDLISLGDVAAVDSASRLSSCAWVYHDTTSDDDEIIAKSDTTNNGFMFFRDDVGSVSARTDIYTIYIADSADAENARIEGATNSSVANKWTHVCFSFQGGSATGLRLYVNGREDANSPVSVSTISAIDAGANALTIGSTSAGANYIDGKLDEVQVWNAAISAEQVAEFYRAGQDHYINKTISSTDLSGQKSIPFYIASDKQGSIATTTTGESAYANYQPDANTIGLWHLEEQFGTGAYIKDASGNNNNGTPTGTSYAQGKIGKARNFNGTSDYISPGTTNLPIGNSNYTMEAWIYPISTGSRGIVGWGTWGTANATNALRLESTNQIRNYWWGNDLIVTVPTITTAWHHIVATFDGTTRKIYYDGILAGSDAPGSSHNATSSNFRIGSTNSGEYFSGQIDEVRISNTARTADEIRQSYEVGLRSHNIVIDFKAALNSGNLIADSNDKSFTIDSTAFGGYQMGSNLYLGDKIIVKENYNGLEYIAQGTVNTLTTSTGATTVSSWDSGSTFPSGGFTVHATVFKWQREFFNPSLSIDSHRNATTNLTLKINGGSQGANIWIDDMKYNTAYATTPAGSTISSTVGSRYFQYRAIQTTADYQDSSSLTSFTIDYVSNVPPNTPTLSTPADGSTGLLQPISVTLSATDTNSDYLQYKLEICKDLEMTLNCTTIDQSLSQTGWSGQNADGNTAYTSGTTATYSLSGLLYGQSYYWRGYALDPDGSNTWSGTQATPNQFSTNGSPRGNASAQPSTYSSRRIDEQVSTTTGWAYVNGIADTGTTGSTYSWIDSSNLVAGRRYLILASGSFNTDNVSAKGGLRIMHGATHFAHSESVDITDRTFYKQPYFWFTIWTAVAGEDLDFQLYWDGTGTQARSEDLSLVAIDVETLITSGDLQYNESTAYTNLTTSYQDTASITFTPSNNNDIWWIMGYNHTSLNNGGAGSLFESQLNINGVTHSDARITVVANSLSPVVSIGYVEELANSSNTIKVSAKETTSDQVSQASSVFALRLSAFENVYASTIPTGDQMDTSGNWVTQISGKPVNSYNNSEWIAVAGGTVNDSGTRVIGRITESGTSITDNVGGWEMGSGDKTALILFDYKMNLSSGLKNFSFDAQTTIDGISTINDPWLVAFSTEKTPNYPTMDLPVNGTTSALVRPALKTTAVDPDANNLRYKIQMCTDSAMTQNCNTYDQTVLQTGWSGQNANSGTAYTSGTQATYTITANLPYGTTYYWRSYAIDFAGNNSFTGNNPNVYSFTTTYQPTAPTLLWAEGESAPVNVLDQTPEFSAIYNDPDPSDTAASYQIQVNTQNDFAGTSMWDSGKHSITVNNGARSSNVSYAGTTLQLNGSTYYWRIRFWDINDIQGAWSSAAQFTMKKIEPTTGCYLIKSPSSDSLTFTWRDNSSLEEGFQIQRKVDGGSFTNLISRAPNETTYTDDTITFGHTYTYRVATMHGTTYGDWCTSSPASVFQGSIKFEGIQFGN